MSEILQLEHLGGMPGLRDESLVESALAQPEAGFGGQYPHADKFEMAVPADELYDLVISVIAGSADRAAVASAFRAASVRARASVRQTVVDSGLVEYAAQFAAGLDLAGPVPDRLRYGRGRACGRRPVSVGGLG